MTETVEPACVLAGTRDAGDWKSRGAALVIAAVAITIGVLVYAFDRNAAMVYFMPAALAGHRFHAFRFAGLGGQLPGFLHVYAFILLSLAVDFRHARVIPVCASWAAIDGIFEVAQHPAIGPGIAAAVPDWFAHIRFLEAIPDYFVSGKFDPWDLVAIGLGTVAAFMTCEALFSRRDGNETRL